MVHVTWHAVTLGPQVSRSKLPRKPRAERTSMEVLAAEQSHRVLCVHGPQDPVDQKTL